MGEMNRLANCKNEFQGKAKKVLCVCSAELLRSPTTAVVLSREPFNFNTRAAGLSKEFALIPVDKVLLEWCDEIVCMEPHQASTLAELTDKTIVCLDIEDIYPFRDPELMALVKKMYEECMRVIES